MRWRYHLVADGFAVVVPRSDVAAAQRDPGRREGLAERALPRARRRPTRGGWVAIGANALWGATSRPPGNGMKIGIIDDGVDAAHPYFNPTGFQYPPGFPKGQTAVHDAEGDRPADVRAARTPSGSTRTCRSTRQNSFHATHVAGIAAGDYDTNAQRRR